MARSFFASFFDSVMASLLVPLDNNSLLDLGIRFANNDDNWINKQLFQLEICVLAMAHNPTNGRDESNSQTVNRPTMPSRIRRSSIATEGITTTIRRVLTSSGRDKKRNAEEMERQTNKRMTSLLLVNWALLLLHVGSINWECNKTIAIDICNFNQYKHLY